MDDPTRLDYLKADLQQRTTANDDYLMFLLDAAENAIKEEGMKDNGEPEYDLVVIQYAAYLFRKRGSSNTEMPRFLRYKLNNMKLRQFRKEDNGDGGDI